MKNIDFGDCEQFAKLERQAYDGTLDISSFPAAEYRYFDKLTVIGQSHRHGALPSDFCKKAKTEAFANYRADIEQNNCNINVQRAYQTSIRKADELRCEINKAKIDNKLPLALKCIELLTGEIGFMERNMKNEIL